MNFFRQFSHAVLLCAGIALVSPLSAAPSLTPSERDRQVLEALLLHLLADQDFNLTRISTNDATIVLDARTPEGTGFLASQQIRQDTGGYKLPGDAQRDLRRRNTPAGARVDTYASLPAFYTNLTFASGIVVADLSSVWKNTRSYTAFENAYPKARGWVEAYLPGYSNDGSRAVVRAAIGPWPHGAVVTALLEKRGEKWIVKWHYKALYA